MPLQSEFRPNWASAPGATIEDILMEKRLTVEQLEKRLGFSAEEMRDLLEGRATITLRIAKQLAETLGGTIEFWMTRDAQYRADIARLQSDGCDWVKTLPLGDMIKYGWLEKTPRPSEELATCLGFFGVTSVKDWHERYERVLTAAAYRSSRAFDSHPASVAAWLRRGEMEAKAIKSKRWNAQLFRDLLNEIRSLTRVKDPEEFVPKLSRICSECGVAVAVVRAPNGCTASGATMFIRPDKAMILLSFRYLSDDQFWFTFFHEAAHLLLHGRDQVFLEGLQPVSQKHEDEANAFAEEILIPGEHKEEFLKLKPELRPILRFAKTIGVSAGVIVGQLQHFRRIPRNHFNNLKTRYIWKD